MSNNSSDISMDDTSSILATILNANEKDFAQIVEASIIYLCNKNKLDSLNLLNQCLIQMSQNAESSIAMSTKEISKWLIKYLSQAVFNQNVEINKIGKYFQTVHGLDETKALIIKKMWEKHLPSLKEATSSHSFMISQLVDMEWKFGVTASTNTIKKFGNAFLQLKLVYNKGDSLETKFIELTLPQFYSFLHEMNKAKSQMDYLS